MAEVPLEVTSTPGWITAIGTVLLTLLGGGGAAAVVSTWIKQRNPRRQIEIKAEEKMREELMVQLQARDTRIDHLERLLEKERVQSANEMGLMEHQIKGLEQLLQTTFELLRVVAPERLPEVIGRMMEGWDKHKERIAIERGEIMAAREHGTAAE